MTYRPSWTVEFEDNGDKVQIFITTLVADRDQAKAVTEAIKALLEYMTADNPNKLGETVYIRDAIEKARQLLQEPTNG